MRFLNVLIVMENEGEEAGRRISATIKEMPGINVEATELATLFTKLYAAIVLWTSGSTTMPPIR